MHFWWVVEGGRMDLGTLPGVSENLGVGLIGVLLQRFAERLSVCVCACVCTRVFLYACVRVVAAAGVG